MVNNTVHPPFSCTYTPQLPELMVKLKCSLMISTYQAGKLVMISPNGQESLTMLPRTFEKPMGIALDGKRMAVACKDRVVTLENEQELAKGYPKKPNTYDAMWMPRLTYHTGMVDLHDLAFGKEGIWAVNTSFSCLCKLTGNYNFEPQWQPKFITELVSQDRCHLNGLVMQDGHPRYVTALGSGNTTASWRENITKGGVLIDLKTDEIVFDGLGMPHSPQLHNGQLYGLLSSEGKLVRFDIQNKKIEVVKELEGFCRGLDIIEDYAFVGMSKLRKNSSTFAKLDFAKTANTAGVKVIHLPTGALVGELAFQTSVDEIYEVKVLPDMIRPNIMNTMSDQHNYALAIPGKTFWAREEPEK